MEGINSNEIEYSVDEIQLFGKQLHAWMSSATAPGCIVPRSHLTLTDLKSPPWIVDYEPKCPRPEDAYLISQLGSDWPTEAGVEDSESRYRCAWILQPDTNTQWTGFIGPGLMIMYEIRRNREAGDPRITDISKAVYEETYELTSLQHVFFTEIVNRETRRIVLAKILPDPIQEEEGTWTFEMDSDEFQVLLGTQLGRTVARMILGAFGQGVKRVERITVMVLQGVFDTLRFDIGDC